MGRKTRTEDLCILAGVFIFMWALLYSKAPFRLDLKEQLSIFLLGADRVEWYLSNPAIAASIIGDWLTQFYSSRILSSLISISLILSVVAGLARLFRISEPQRPVCLPLLVLPALLECFFVSFPNYPVSATVGLALSVWTATALARIKDSEWSSFIYGLSVPVMFVIAGSHAFTMALLLAFIKRKDGSVPYISLIAGIALMLICGRLYNLTFYQTLIWPVTPGYIIPGAVWMILMPWFVLAVTALSLLYDKWIGNRWRSLVPAVLFCMLIPLIFALDNKEMESTVKIGTLAYRNNWKEVKQMAASAKPKDRNMYSDYYWNLCNAREGRLADFLLQGGWGRSKEKLFLSTTRGDSYFSSMYYTDALLEMGDISQATDCALLVQTIVPGHYSTRMLRRLSEIAVVAGDYPVAAKYLNILMRTRNHRRWARELMDCIQKDSIPDMYLRWRSKACSTDRFFVQGDSRSSLAIIASQSPYNREAIDYLMCSCLLDKNLNSFIGLYDKYYLNALDKVVEVPVLYQEALLVNVNSNESLQETVRKYNISTDVVNKYLELMDARAHDQHPESVMTGNAMGSYWHYIMAVRFNN